MRKTFLFSLFLILGVLTGSCSGGDDALPAVISSPSEEIAFKLNGIHKSFENTHVGNIRFESGTAHTRTITATEKGNPGNTLSFKLVHNPSTNVKEIQLLKYSIDNEDVFNLFQATSSITYYNNTILRGTFLGTDGDNEIREGVINITW